MTSKCSITGCANRCRARGWCNTHYERWRKYGNPLASSKRVRSLCSITNCGRPNRARSLCATHYMRWWKRGSALIVLPGYIPPPGEAHHSWQGDDIGYWAAHSRLEASRGRAAQYACCDCDGVATEWSFNHATPKERTYYGAS